MRMKGATVQMQLFDLGPLEYDPATAELESSDIVITDEWLAGFCDGECSIGVGGHGGNLQPRFRLNQRDDDADLIRAIRAHLALGSLHRRYDKSSSYAPGGNAKPQLCLSVAGSDCMRLVDIFDRYPLRSKKRHEYPHWRRAVCVYSARKSNRWRPWLTVARGELLAPLKVLIEASRIYRGPT